MPILIGFLIGLYLVSAMFMLELAISHRKNNSTVDLVIVVFLYFLPGINTAVVIVDFMSYEPKPEPTIDVEMPKKTYLEMLLSYVGLN